MKKLTFLLLFAPLFIQAQQYIDILKIDYGTAFNSAFNETNNSTDINTFNMGLTVPIVLNDKHALITGVNFSMDKLQLFPKWWAVYSSGGYLSVALLKNRFKIINKIKFKKP